jgi:hypothetical protein
LFKCRQGYAIHSLRVPAAALEKKRKTTDIQIFVSSLDQVKLGETRKLVDPFSGRPEPLAMTLDRRGLCVAISSDVVMESLRPDS